MWEISEKLSSQIISWTKKIVYKCKILKNQPEFANDLYD